MMEDFAKCKWAESCGHEICLQEFCDEYEAVKMTNADRIRAMSDKELAELICKHKPMHSWPKEVQKIYYSTRMTGVEAWTHWLQQPAGGKP